MRGPVQFKYLSAITKKLRNSHVLGKTLNSSVVVPRTTLNSLGAIWEMIPSVAAICAAAVDFPCWSYPTFCVV